MKLRAFLEKKNSQAKLSNEDFNKMLETLPDIELPDAWVNLIEESFLTRERAEADPAINKKIFSQALNAVDANIERLLPLLDVKDREEIAKESSSYKKIELLQKAIPNLMAKVKDENPSDNEKVKQLEKNVKEFADKLTAQKQEYETSVKDIISKHEAEKSNLRLDWTLDKKFSEFTFADEFKPIQSAIVKNIIDTIKTANTLQLDDKGNIVVVEIDPQTQVAKPKFNGNDPVTIDVLLAEPVKNFLKRNNGTETKTNGTGTTSPTIRTTPGDKDPSKMTLQEKRVYMAQQSAANG